MQISDAVEAILVQGLVEITKDRRRESASVLSSLENSPAAEGCSRVVTADDYRADIACMDAFIAGAEAELAEYAARH